MDAPSQFSVSEVSTCILVLIRVVREKSVHSHVKVVEQECLLLLL